MFAMFKTVKLNLWRSLLALIILIFADWGMMTSYPIFSGRLDWTFLPIGGSACFNHTDWLEQHKHFIQKNQ